MTDAPPYERLMTRCNELALRGAGFVSPNPMVGCVIVADTDEVVGEGWHRKFGGSHAEVEAVADAENRRGPEVLKRSTLVVNLEPCNHHGKTPPCTDLIIEKRIRRVVVGLRDPNPKVAGSGLRRLREAGIEVIEGVLSADCARLNEAFLCHIATGRPLVVLKMAQSLDGCVATPGGESKWISGETSRRRVHEIRAHVDAVLVGSGTVAADDPALTVRMVEGRQPLRVVLDREGRLASDRQVFTDSYAERTVVVIGSGRKPAYRQALESRGGSIMEIKERDGHIELGAVLTALGTGSGRRSPVQSVLVEAGPALATALLRSRLVDRLHLFIAPKIIGADGIRTFGSLEVGRLAQAESFPESSWEQVGDDMLFTGYARSAETLVTTRSTIVSKGG